MKAILYADGTFRGLVPNETVTKPSLTREWVVVSSPTPGNGEVVVETSPVITETQAIQTWIIRQKNAEEIAKEISEGALRDRDAAIRNAMADLKLIRNSSGRLTLDQVSDAVRALAKALVALIEELRP